MSGIYTFSPSKQFKADKDSNFWRKWSDKKIIPETLGLSSILDCWTAKNMMPQFVSRWSYLSTIEVETGLTQKRLISKKTSAV